MLLAGLTVTHYIYNIALSAALYSPPPLPLSLEVIDEEDMSENIHQRCCATHEQHSAETQGRRRRWPQREGEGLDGGGL